MEEVQLRGEFLIEREKRERERGDRGDRGGGKVMSEYNIKLMVRFQGSLGVFFDK